MIYGASYMGSKTAIAEDIVNFLPKGERFVDLFGGGFAISHCVLINHILNNQISLFGQKWKSLLYNDYDSLVVDMIKKAINGEFSYKNFKPKFITKEEFNNLKTKYGYVKYCWSFGNNGKSYLYNDIIAPYKYACHQAIVFDDWEDMKELCPEVWEVAYNNIKDIKDIQKRRLGFAPPIVKELKRIGDWDLVQLNPLYKSCHWRGKGLNSEKNDNDLQRLQSLESLQSLERLEISNINYLDYEYKEGDVVYCDIPYENTCEYTGGFNHKEFYNWAYTRPYKVYFSSYEISDKRFKKVWQKEKRSTFSPNNNCKKVEYIYTNKC